MCNFFGWCGAAISSLSLVLQALIDEDFIWFYNRKVEIKSKINLMITKKVKVSGCLKTEDQTLSS